jgi:hypothetical protein
MNITYMMHTPNMLDAKEQAVILAHSQGFKTAMVTAIDQPEYGEYQVTLVVNK